IPSQYRRRLRPSAARAARSSTSRARRCRTASRRRRATPPARSAVVENPVAFGAGSLPVLGHLTSATTDAHPDAALSRPHHGPPPPPRHSRLGAPHEQLVVVRDDTVAHELGRVGRRGTERGETLVRLARYPEPPPGLGLRTARRLDTAVEPAAAVHEREAL